MKRLNKIRMLFHNSFLGRAWWNYCRGRAFARCEIEEAPVFIGMDFGSEEFTSCVVMMNNKIVDAFRLPADQLIGSHSSSSG